MPTSAADRAIDHALLSDAVRAAGAIAKRYFRSDQKVWEKQPGHPVGEADIAVNEWLQKQLSGARPDYGWLSEESADGPARLSARRVWVVDPIDGTRSFLKGCTEVAIAAALIEQGRPSAAVVFNPATDEFFEAVRGQGARLNGNAISVSATARLEDARLVSSRTEMERKTWADRFKGNPITPISSIAYKLALVAAGRFDALISLWGKHEWDLAAGDLLVSEAGGHVTTAEGEALAYNRENSRLPSCVASNGRLHDALMAALEP